MQASVVRRCPVLVSDQRQGGLTLVTDVVVVGGGIGGASLAYGLAQAGKGVTVLEASTRYSDRVRGESMQAWGVAEARRLGVEQVLLDAGAHVSPLWKQYAEGVGEAGDIPMSMMVPDIPGCLNLRHPDACQALVDAAAAAGAEVIRGVRDVNLAPGGVSYATDQVHELHADLVVGADGRNSAIRRQVGIELEHQEATSYIAGLLLDGLDGAAGMPDGFDMMATEGDRFLLVFHQGHGRARVYICVGLSGQHRFSGPGGINAFLAATPMSCFPWSESFTSAVPAGPCATYPGDDTWTAEPYAEGVVLIGDAAGYNDPVIGQGLSIAVRDARTVRDLILDGAHEPADFAPYGEERLGRMARLRLAADVLAAAVAEDAPNRSARRALYGLAIATMDPEIFPVLLAAFTGPETVPDELVNEAIIDRVRAAT
jgi:2-polyprenyl-6-methoxyphenol hydroxylase-like FAD-dependent oxidoreductase